MSDNLKLGLIFDLVDESARDMKKITDNLNKMKKALDKNGKEQQDLQKITKKTASVFKKEFNFLNTGLGSFLSVGALTALVTKGVKGSMELADGLAEVATLTDKSAKEIEDSFKPIVNSIRRTFGKESQDVIKSLYDGVSAGVPATEAAANDFLKSVSKMSIGGRSSMQSAGDLITTVVNSFTKESLTYEQASNAMFGAVREGKTTIDQLSQSLGQVSTLANTVGVGVSEVAASIATLTSSGVKTPEAMTKLKGALKALAAPTDAAKKAFADLGIKSIGALMASFKENKLTNTLEVLNQKLKKNSKSTVEYNEKLNKLFPDSEGYLAVTALMVDQNEKFRSSLKGTSTDAGQASKAFQKMKTDSLDMKNAQQELNIALESIGESLTPYLAKTATYVSGFFDNLRMIIREADQITRLNKEEEQNKKIAQDAIKADVGKSFGSNFGTTVLNALTKKPSEITADRDKSTAWEKRIIEVKIDIAGSSELTKKTSQQVALELLPELKKVVREESRRKLNGKGPLANFGGK